MCQGHILIHFVRLGANKVTHLHESRISCTIFFCVTALFCTWKWRCWRNKDFWDFWCPGIYFGGPTCMDPPSKCIWMKGSAFRCALSSLFSGSFFHWFLRASITYASVVVIFPWYQYKVSRLGWRNYVSALIIIFFMRSMMYPVPLFYRICYGFEKAVLFIAPFTSSSRCLCGSQLFSVPIVSATGKTRKLCSAVKFQV